MPPFPPSSHRIIPLFPSPILFIPVPYRSVSSLFLLHSLSLSRSFHPLCGHVPPSLPLSSLSSLRFRPLPLSRRYFRDDELQYAPIVAAGNQRAYPKSSMVSTHPTQPKPSLAQPGTRPIRTYIYIYIYIYTQTRACIQRDGEKERERESHITWLRLYRYKHVEEGQRKE